MDGRYCRLEPVDPDTHAAALFAEFALDPEGRNWTYLPYGPFENPDAYRTWMKETCLGDDALFFAIVDRQSGKALGVDSYLRIMPESGSFEVGPVVFSERL
jgi:RimJ/RimL family protein N-acetyltransferase